MLAGSSTGFGWTVDGRCREWWSISGQSYASLALGSL
jgi:hypothetical protein